MGRSVAGFRAAPARPMVAAAVVFVAAAALLFARAAPGVTFEDSGQLAAAAVSWGVPHPPGYPVWMLVAAPLSSLAALLGLDPAGVLVGLSTVCAAGAAAVLGAVAAALGASLPVAAAAGLIVLAAPTFTSQALIVEVYALAAAIQAALLAAALVGRPRPLLVGLLAGLGLAAHASTLLLAPLAIYGAVRGGGWRGLPRAAAGGALGLASFAWVPLAALREPALNWGGASTADRLIDHLSRRQYVGAGGELGPRILFALEQALTQWPAVALVAVVAAPLLVGRHGRLAAVVATAVGLSWSLVAGVAALPYDVSPEALRYRVAPLFIPSLLIASVSFGLALIGLERWIGTRTRRAPWLAAGLGAATAFVPMPSLHSDSTHMAAADGADRYLRTTLEACPPDAIVVCSRLGYTDVLSFPLLYGQIGLGLRPDVVVLDRALLPSPWYREQLARRLPEIAPALAALENTYASDPVRFADPRQRRLASAEFLQVLFDGERPVVMVERPGPNVLRGRPIAPDAALWRIGVEPVPAIEPIEPSWPWLESQPPSPWTAELRAIAEERDAARAELLRAAGRSAEADRLGR